MTKTVTQSVRDVEMTLLTTTRSLELCARMNYETEVMDVIEMAEPGSVFCDLGACEGRFSVYAAKCGLNVVSIEPERRNYKALQTNRELNNLSTEQMQTFQVAVGNRNAEVEINVGQPWEGGHQKVLDLPETRVDLNFEVKEKQLVEMVRLDDFWKDRNLPIPRTMKVDIDGAERVFLEGAKELLKTPDLKRFLIELQVQDENFGFINNLLQELGFNFEQKWAVPNEPDLFNFLFVRT